MEPASGKSAGNIASPSDRWVAQRSKVGFFILCVAPAAVAAAWGFMPGLLALISRNDTFAYVPLIPLTSLCLVYLKRKSIFSEFSNDWRTGGALVIMGSICLAFVRSNTWQYSLDNRPSVLMLGFVLVWMGAFALFFGQRSFREAAFPLLLLFFAIPIPDPPLSQITSTLQQGSAKAAEGLFSLFGVPFLRNGLDFALPGITIRVAEECSGIRSSLALLITTTLASHFFLRSPWRRLVLCIAVVPLAILKNGLRIVVLSVLSIYVNPDFLRGRLHHEGGIVFFLIALVPLAVFLILLQKGEKPDPAVAKVV